MDNLSDLLPIVIILGSFVFSIVQASRKKKQQSSQETVSPEAYRQEESPERSFEMPSQTPPSKKRSKKRITEIDHNPEVKRTVLAPAEATFLEEPEEESAEFTLDLSDTEDWKRAIVYSEILNRKTY